MEIAAHQPFHEAGPLCILFRRVRAEEQQPFPGRVPLGLAILGQGRIGFVQVGLSVIQERETDRLHKPLQGEVVHPMAAGGVQQPREEAAVGIFLA